MPGQKRYMPWMPFRQSTVAMIMRQISTSISPMLRLRRQSVARRRSARRSIIIVALGICWGICRSI